MRSPLTRSALCGNCHVPFFRILLNQVRRVHSVVYSNQKRGSALHHESISKSETDNPAMLELESSLAHNERAKDRSLWLQIDQPAISLVIIFSLLYFAQTLILAGEKTFWFDEIRSLEICRLPTFHAAWNAVLAGADFNPPLFYLIQRGNR